MREAWGLSCFSFPWILFISIQCLPTLNVSAVPEVCITVWSVFEVMQGSCGCVALVYIGYSYSSSYIYSYIYTVLVICYIYMTIYTVYIYTVYICIYTVRVFYIYTVVVIYTVIYTVIGFSTVICALQTTFHYSFLSFYLLVTRKLYLSGLLNDTKSWNKASVCFYFIVSQKYILKGGRRGSVF